MKSTKNKRRYRHSEETKLKISISNTGKKFSEEQKRNIGKAREIILTEDQLLQLHLFWSKQYIPENWILRELNLSERVYRRYKKQHCKIEQIKFLPRDLEPLIFETIIQMCKNGDPYKDIAKKLDLGLKKTRSIILKLSTVYDIKPIGRTQPPKTQEHIEKLKYQLITYNKLFPKKKDKHPNWKGGISSLSELIRAMPKYKEWQKVILKRDKFECINCKSKKSLHVDHIYPFVLLLLDGKIKTIEDANNYSPLWNENNGRILCEICHKKTETYGKHRNKYNEKF